MTTTEFFLLLWGAVASGTAWYYKSDAAINRHLLRGAAQLTHRLIVDSKYRESWVAEMQLVLAIRDAKFKDAQTTVSK